MRLTAGLFLLTSLSTAHAAAAQQWPAAVYVQGGLTLNHQTGDTGTVSETYVTAPGGTTLGWLAGGGLEFGSRVAVGVEWASTGTMKATEPSRYFTTFKEERRDRFLIVEGRLVLRPSQVLAIEPMAGVAFTFPEASSQAVYTDPIFPRPADPVVRHRLNAGIGPAFGCDVRIGRRVAVVPAFRIIRSAVDSGRYDDTSPEDVDISSVYPGGYPAWTTRGSVAVRVGF